MGIGMIGQRLLGSQVPEMWSKRWGGHMLSVLQTPHSVERGAAGEGRE